MRIKSALKDQRGVAPALELLLVLIVIGVVGFIGYRAYQARNAEYSTQVSTDEKRKNCPYQDVDNVEVSVGLTFRYELPTGWKTGKANATSGADGCEVVIIQMVNPAGAAGKVDIVQTELKTGSAASVASYAKDLGSSLKDKETVEVDGKEALRFSRTDGGGPDHTSTVFYDGGFEYEVRNFDLSESGADAYEEIIDSIKFE